MAAVAVDALHRIGVKVFTEEGDGLELVELIPVFHRWIQDQALPDLLIDVADYSHVPAGPGILLVAHEGNYGLDETGERRGMVYYSKHELPGALAERMACVLRKALEACRLLEQEEATRGRVRFRADRIQFFANDRLHAPNDAPTREALQGPLQSLLDRLYPDGGYRVEAGSEDPRERLCVTVHAGAPADVQSALGRLAA